MPIGTKVYERSNIMQNAVIERKTGGGQTESEHYIGKTAKVTLLTRNKKRTTLLESLPIRDAFADMDRANGFTLAEILVTILIVGILAAITLPVVQKAHPDKLEAMRKKSYYILENTVSQIYGDDTMYRNRVDGSLQGLRNTEKVKINGKIFEGKTKFCELFANSLNKRAGMNTNCAAGQKTFTSTDNVDWYLPVTDFSSGYAEVKFDVNGKSEPNCEYNASNCQHPDIFKYFVMSNGKITEQNPNPSIVTYCIKTSVTGRGTVSPSVNYCGLENGIFTITAVPESGWISNWQNNKKTVKIKNKDESINVVFTESPKACIKLNVNCEAGFPDKCGNYTISNAIFSTNGNELSACGLSEGLYTINITPKTNYTPSWQTKDIVLNGSDQNLSISISQNKSCATLDVECPDGGANVCGNYIINGNGTTYGMDISANTVKSCALTNGSYYLTVTPDNKYRVNKDNFNFTIANNNWNDYVVFKRKCNQGEFEAGGKCFSKPFKPNYLTVKECETYKSLLGIKECHKDSNPLVDYWAGAVKQCGGINKMPTREDLANIASIIYEGNPSIPYLGSSYNDVVVARSLNYVSGKASSLGFPEPAFNVWSGDEWSVYDGWLIFGAYSRYFGTDSTSSNHYMGRDISDVWAICKVGSL